MQGDKIYTTYDMLEIFPVMWLEFLISTSKVFEIGFSELKGYLVRLLHFCHGCYLVKIILTSDPLTTSNMAKTVGATWELGKSAGKKNGKRYLGTGTTLITPD